MSLEISESTDKANKCNNKYESILNGSNLNGGAIRDIAKGLLEISDDLHPYFKAKVIVLDTNIILKDLKYIVSNQVASKLYAETEFEFTRLFITPSVAAEVVEIIPKFSRNTHIDPNEMYEAWEAYKKSLIIFDARQASTIDRINQLRQRDPDDVPTAELIELIAPNLALSMDKDLKAFGYAQTGSWLEYVLNTSNIITDDSIQVVFTFCSRALFVGIAESLSWITHTLKKVPKRIATIIISTLSISTLMLLADTRSRKWISSKFKNITSIGDSQLKDKLISVLRQVEEYADQSRQLRKHIESVRPNFEAALHLKQHIIQILVRAHRPLSTTQLLESAIRQGYKPRGSDPEKYLRRILSDDPMFIKNEEGFWSLNIQTINGFKVVINE